MYLRFSTDFHLRKDVEYKNNVLTLAFLLINISLEYRYISSVYL